MKNKILKIGILVLSSLLGGVSLSNSSNFIAKAEEEFTSYSLDDLGIEGFKANSSNVAAQTTSNQALKSSTVLAEKSVLNLRYKCYSSERKNFFITVGGYGVYVSAGETLRFIRLTNNSEVYSRNYEAPYSNSTLKDSNGVDLKTVITGNQYFTDFIDAKITFDLSGEYGKVSYEVNYNDVTYRPYTSTGELIDSVTFSAKPVGIQDRLCRIGSSDGNGNYLIFANTSIDNDPTARKEYVFDAEDIYNLKTSVVQTDLTLSSDGSSVLFHCKATGSEVVDPYVYFSGKILKMVNKFDSFKLEYKLVKDIPTEFNSYSFYNGSHKSSSRVKYSYSEDYQTASSLLPDIGDNIATEFRIDYICSSVANDVYIKSLTFFNNDGSYSPNVEGGDVGDAFTHNGQFSVSGGTSSFISPEDAPSGANSNELLKITGSTSNVVTFTMNERLKVEDYGEISFRVYSKGTPTSTYPEFRVQKPGKNEWLVIGKDEFKGAGGISLVSVNNSWYVISFGTSVISDIQNPDYIGGFSITYRTQVATDTLYIDSVNFKFIERKTIAFNDVAGGWNNTLCAEGRQTVLWFGVHGVDYFGSAADTTNICKEGNKTAEHVTINGKPLYEYSGSIINYAHYYVYFYFCVNESALLPSNGYKVTTFHIDEGTPFMDNRMAEVTLYMVNGQWSKVYPETTNDDEYISLKDAFDTDYHVFDNDVLISKDSLSLEQGFNAKFVGNFAGINGEIALKIFDKYVIRVEPHMIKIENNGSTISSKAVSTNKIIAFLIEIEVKISASNVIIKAGLDGLNHLSATFVKPDSLANELRLMGTSGTNVMNYSGKDFRAPLINNYGPKAYYRYEGDPVLDLSNIINAYDTLDGDVTNTITITYQDGAIIDNKLVKGDWKIFIDCYDKDDNHASLTLRLVVYGNQDEVSVTFNNENQKTYHIGDKVSKPEDPTKESDQLYSYKFDGWYVGDYKWDFENDELKENTNFEARFIESVREYQVTFNFEGINKESITLYVTFNTTVTFDMFALDGYTFVALVNGSECTSVVITEDTVITVKYTEDKPDNPDNPDEPDNPDTPSTKKGCGGSIIASTGLISIISLLGITLLSLKRKEER